MAHDSRSGVRAGEARRWRATGSRLGERPNQGWFGPEVLSERRTRELRTNFNREAQTVKKLRRGVRAVEGARLESVYTAKSVSRVRIPLSPPSNSSTVGRVGPLATGRCQPRQARKGATVTARSGAEVWLTRTATIVCAGVLVPALFEPHEQDPRVLFMTSGCHY